MSDYTVTNLRDVEDAAPANGLGDLMEARFAAGELGLARSGVSLQRLAPGKGQPFAHMHKEQEELFVVVDGAGRVRLDGEEVALRTWDAVRVAPGVMRAFAAGPEGMEFLAFGAPTFPNPREEFETEPAEW